jgi:hypothetical protein
MQNLEIVGGGVSLCCLSWDQRTNAKWKSVETAFFTLPRLNVVGGGFSSTWIKGRVSLPCLEDVGGDLNIHSAESISCPLLRNVGRVFYADNAVTVLLPKLKTVGFSFLAGTASDLYCSELEIVGGELSLGSIENVFLPRLLTVGDFFVITSAKKVSCASLKYVGGALEADSAITLSLPCLESVGGSSNGLTFRGITALAAEKVFLPKLEYTNDDIKVSAKTDVVISDNLVKRLCR